MFGSVCNPVKMGILTHFHTFFKCRIDVLKDMVDVILPSLFIHWLTVIRKCIRIVHDWVERVVPAVTTSAMTADAATHLAKASLTTEGAESLVAKT